MSIVAAMSDYQHGRCLDGINDAGAASLVCCQYSYIGDGNIAVAATVASAGFDTPTMLAWTLLVVSVLLLAATVLLLLGTLAALVLPRVLGKASEEHCRACKGQLEGPGQFLSTGAVLPQLYSGEQVQPNSLLPASQPVPAAFTSRCVHSCITYERDALPEEFWTHCRSSYRQRYINSATELSCRQCFEELKIWM